MAFSKTVVRRKSGSTIESTYQCDIVLTTDEDGASIWVTTDGGANAYQLTYDTSIGEYQKTFVVKCPTNGQIGIIAGDGAWIVREFSTYVEPFSGLTPSRDTWTPTDDSAGSLSLTVHLAQYWVLGELVFFKARITYPANADGSQIKIGGLPYTSKNRGFNIDSVVCGYSSYSANPINGLVIFNTDYFQMYHTNGTVLTNADLTGKTIVVEGMYERA